LVLHGPVGIGKTGLIVATAHSLMEQGNAVCTSGRRPVRRTQAQFRQPDRLPSIQRSDCSGSPYLILDEFNVSQITDWRLDVMESIIRHRYGNGLPILATCNVDQKQFRDMWGIRTADALFAMAHWVYMSGTKLRQTEGSI
jgi:DNA replication protein DnaC